MKYQFSNKEESPDQRIKTTLLNNLRNLIKQAHADNKTYKKSYKKNLQTNIGCWILSGYCIGKDSTEIIRGHPMIYIHSNLKLFFTSLSSKNLELN
ncbi:hypothetical protein [Borreliella andersonii]|uniref:Uncharacterized protein n=1 Tax=Borrelia andersonii TaxID=42109 RepID=A0ACD5G614_BORAD